MPEKPKSKGRPAKPPVEGARNSLGLRVTAELKRKIKAGAEASGRSQGQEAEYRLEQSFSDDDEIIRFFGDRDTKTLMRIVLFGKELVELATGKSMHEDYETSVAAKCAMSAILDSSISISGDDLEKSADYVKREHVYTKEIDRLKTEYKQRTGKEIKNWLAVMSGVGAEGIGPIPTSPAVEAMKRGEAIAKSVFTRLSESVGKDPKEEASLPVDTEN